VLKKLLLLRSYEFLIILLSMVYLFLRFSRSLLLPQIFPKLLNLRFLLVKTYTVLFVGCELEAVAHPDVDVQDLLGKVKALHHE
jgi:uncharacterized membrane protein